jgi:hypothetical protein
MGNREDAEYVAQYGYSTLKMKKEEESREYYLRHMEKYGNAKSSAWAHFELTKCPGCGGRGKRRAFGPGTDWDVTCPDCDGTGIKGGISDSPLGGRKCSDRGCSSTEEQADKCVRQQSKVTSEQLRRDAYILERLQQGCIRRGYSGWVEVYDENGKTIYRYDDSPTWT